MIRICGSGLRHIDFLFFWFRCCVFWFLVFMALPAKSFVLPDPGGTDGRSVKVISWLSFLSCLHFVSYFIFCTKCADSSFSVERWTEHAFTVRSTRRSWHSRRSWSCLEVLRKAFCLICLLLVETHLGQKATPFIRCFWTDTSIPSGVGANKFKTNAGETITRPGLCHRCLQWIRHCNGSKAEPLILLVLVY